MKAHSLLLVTLSLFSAPSCSEEDVRADYEFYIGGVVDGYFLKYPQVNIPEVNVSNTYITEYQATWLQAYRKASDLEAGRWEVRIHGIDIESLPTPYQLGAADGSVEWFDPRIDRIIANNPDCHGLDTGCGFFLLPAEGNELIVTSVGDSIIEGRFSGRLILQGTKFNRFRDTTLFHTVEEGRFRIKYRPE